MTRARTYRQPQAFDPDDPAIVPTPPDPSATATAASSDETASLEPAPAAADTATAPTRSRLIGPWAATFLASVLALASLAASLWFARFVSVALARDDWVGILANTLLALLVISAAVIALREAFGLWRLQRLTRIRRAAQIALANKNRAAEQHVIARLKHLASLRRDRAWALAAFREQERHMREPGELLALADRVLLGSSDTEARRIVYESARRVGIVTAMVPIAVLSMLFVFSEILRMIRRLATAYGGRPGFLGGVKLFSGVLAHIAATGAIALTDDLIGQFFGQDLARRVSRRLGEGAFNAALTARLGVAAIDVCRPLPFIVAPRIRIRAILSELFPELKPGARLRSTMRSHT